MREIKFRACFQSKMNYDYQDTTDVDLFGFTDSEYFKIMQYTGLKDMNGKEIYEGDILGCESNGVNKYELRVVCYDSHQAKYKSVPLSTYHSNAGNGGWTGYELYRTYCEVIGNICENPELLK